MNLHRLRTLSITALAATLSLAACGSDHSSMDSSSDTVATGGLNVADIEFAQAMIAHHEQAIEMAEIALDPTTGASAAVVDLATRIKGAQDPEVEVMTGWLTAAGEPVAMDASDGHDMSSMEGMMSAEQMDALASMAGPEFDQIWLGMMVAHHEGAISQSETVKADGASAEVRALAEQIITAQQAEITEMQALITS